jgi:hypothetical protein
LTGERRPAVPLKRRLVRRPFEPYQNAGEIEFAPRGVQLEQRFVLFPAALGRREVFERLSEHVHAAGHGERARALVDDDASDLKAVFAKRLQFSYARRGRLSTAQRAADRRREPQRRK